MATASETPAPAQTWTVEVLLIVIGLTLGWVLGLAGSFFETYGTAQNVLFLISSMGWIAGTAILSPRSAAAARPTGAAGFMVLAISEAAIWAHGGPTGSAEGFAIVAGFFAVGLLLIGLTLWGPEWACVASLLGALGFAIVSIVGQVSDPWESDHPVAIAAYVLTTIAAIGWTLTVIKERAST